MVIRQKIDGDEVSYGCSQCGRTYKRKFLVARHLRYECGKEPQFACPHCPYKAKYKTSLKSHLLFKHNE